MLQVQIVSGVLIIVCATLILNMVRIRKLELKYALPWLTGAFLLIVVDIFPVILFRISEFIGVATPVNTLFLLAFCFIIALIFVLTITISRMSERIRKLTQIIAINEEKLNELSALSEKNK